MEEWQFFLKGGTVLDRSQQAPNPAPHWISEQMWDNITVRHRHTHTHTHTAQHPRLPAPETARKHSLVANVLHPSVPRMTMCVCVCLYVCVSCSQELDYLANFKGLVSSFDSSTGEWERWYRQVCVY